MGRTTVWVLIGGAIAALVYFNRTEILVIAKRVSDSGLNLIAKLETFSAMPYPDARGQSVGFGHYILPSDNFSFPISRADGQKLLLSDSRIADEAIDRYVRVPLTANQRDALVSLIYNIGVSHFATSTLLKRLNVGDYAGAAGQFDVWRKSEGSVLPVLVARRAIEKQLFLTA